MVGTKPAGERQRRGSDVDDGDLGDAGAPCRQHCQQSDRTGAKQHRAFTADIAGPGDRVQANGKRLGQCRRLIRHVVRNFYALRGDRVEH